MQRALSSRTALVVVLAVTVGVGRVHGQQPASDAEAGEPIEDAARAFARGREAFEARRFDEALEAFRRAYTLAPHDRVRFNIAVVLEELGRFREAAVEYDAVAASHQLDDDTRARASASAQAARARLARLAIRSPEGAIEVEVAGAASCATPCELEIDPGEHTIAYRIGDRAAERRVRAVSGARLAIVLDVARAERPIDRAEPVAPPADSSIDIGVLGAIGIGGVLVGGAGTIGFGLRATALYDEYQRAGCGAVSCDEGELMTVLTNVSIGVLVAGALALLVDLALIDD